MTNTLEKEIKTMTKKELIKNTFSATMTKEEFDKAVAGLPFEIKMFFKKNDKNTINVYDKSGKTKFVSVTIVAPAPKKEKKTKKNSGKSTKKAEYKNKNAELYATCDVPPVKEVGNGYVVFWQFKNVNEVFMDDTMTTCREIKEFIKKLHKSGKIENLNIYKMGTGYFTDSDDIHKTRLSAWVGIEIA